MKYFSPWTRLLAVLITVVIAGCVANRYQIRLRPNGEEVERELTMWRDRTENEKKVFVAFPQDELRRVATAYNTDVPQNAAKKHTFSKVFRANMPDDVGGSGSYTHWNSPLGSVSAYVERFRGQDDLVAEVQASQKAANDLTDLLIGWLSAELADEVGFEKLRQFVDQQLRQDLANISLYGSAYGLVKEHDVHIEHEYFVRIGQYLMERDYFTPDDLPQWTRALQDLDGPGSTRLVQLIQRFMATRMGVAANEPIPAGLHLLSDPSRLETSIGDYLQETDQYKQRLEAWEREKLTNPDAQQPRATIVAEELLVRGFLPGFMLGRSDSLDVQLDASQKPFLTNGTWDAASRRLNWKRDLPAADAELPGAPAILYALWSNPNEEAQRAHFGRIVMEGSDLADYCLWYQGLSAKEKQEWDAFIKRQRPGPGLSDQLSRFRFSHESPDQEGGLATAPVEILLRGLGEN